MSRARWLALALVLAGCGRCGGCGGCGGDAAVAELAEAHGDVRADDAPAPVRFEPTQVGRRFVVGEAVRTGDAATARLTLAGGGTLHVDPQSLVRFQRHADVARVDVEQGTTEVDAPATAPVEIETVFGVARLDPAARARFGAQDGRFEIVVGHATVEAAGAAPVSLSAGAAVTTAGLVRDAGATPAPPRDAGAPRARDAGPAPDGGGTRPVDVRGAGATVQLPGQAEFRGLTAGRHDVAEGSVLRADPGTTIDIRTDDGVVHVEGAAEVALTAGVARAASGRYRVEGGARTRLVVPGGTLVLSGDPGASAADVQVARDGSGSVTVRRGEVVHETAAGARTLHANDVATLAPAGAAGVDAGVTVAAGVDAGGTGAADVPAPDAATPAALTVRVGENVAVHDPRAPSPVRLEAPADCARPAWRVDRRPVPGGAAIVVSLRPGTHAIEARCGGARVRSSVRVDRETGRASLPRSAPRNIVDADGRAYSLLYQTLLPEVVVRWPHAPAHPPFDLDVRHGSSTRTLHAQTPSATFTSGQLGEGTHVLTFRAADGTRSPPTTVHISFDNATPVATIRAPAPGASLGATVTVDGVVAEGAHVSVSGTALPVDGAGHFHRDVPLGPAGCVAVRVAVASRGVHYFLRCRE